MVSVARLAAIKLGVDANPKLYPTSSTGLLGWGELNVDIKLFYRILHVKERAIGVSRIVFLYLARCVIGEKVSIMALHANDSHL